MRRDRLTNDRIQEQQLLRRLRAIEPSMEATMRAAREAAKVGWIRYGAEMSWWERYQAWRPEDAWDRYQTRRLQSRGHFVATAVAVRAVIVFFMLLLTGSSLERTAVITAIFVVVAAVLWWFLYYPRAVTKGQPASDPAGTARV